MTLPWIILLIAVALFGLSIILFARADQYEQALEEGKRHLRTSERLRLELIGGAYDLWAGILLIVAIGSAIGGLIGLFIQ